MSMFQDDEGTREPLGGMDQDQNALTHVHVTLSRHPKDTCHVRLEADANAFNYDRVRLLYINIELYD